MTDLVGWVFGNTTYKMLSKKHNINISSHS